jgi:hypothetical protein
MPPLTLPSSDHHGEASSCDRLPEPPAWPYTTPSSAAVWQAATDCPDQAETACLTFPARSAQRNRPRSAQSVGVSIACSDRMGGRRCTVRWHAGETASRKKNDPPQGDPPAGVPLHNKLTITITITITVTIAITKTITTTTTVTTTISITIAIAIAIAVPITAIIAIPIAVAITIAIAIAIATRSQQRCRAPHGVTSP